MLQIGLTELTLVDMPHPTNSTITIEPGNKLDIIDDVNVVPFFRIRGAVKNVVELSFKENTKAEYDLVKQYSIPYNSLEVYTKLTDSEGVVILEGVSAVVMSRESTSTNQLYEYNLMVYIL